MREVVIPCERVCVIFLPKIAELVCYDKVRLVNIAIAAWLSTITLVTFLCSMSKSVKIFLSYKTWFAAAFAATYSASAVDYVTISCFLKHQEKILDPKLK